VKNSDSGEGTCIYASSVIQFDFLHHVNVAGERRGISSIPLGHRDQGSPHAHGHRHEEPQVSLRLS
jgi:hypothetical protein